MDRQTRKNIEKAILISLVGGAVLISPMGGRVVLGFAQYFLQKWWNKDGSYIPPEADPSQVRESIYDLKRREYVRWKYDKKRRGIILELTAKGKRTFNRRNFDDISIPIPRKWDGRWRFFLFDIPEKRRTFRNALRDKLKKIGFFQFQKSVWIFPFECAKELQYICEYLGIRPYTIAFTAKIDNDRILRRYFMKNGILLRYHVSLRDKGIRY